MEKNKDRRYQTVEALLDDLKNIEDGLPLGTKIRPRRATFIQTLLRKKLLIPALAVILTAIVAIAYDIFRNPEPDLDQNRVVVAIFDNQTGDSAYDFIGRMVVDYISQGLMKTGLIDIVPSMTVGQVYSSYKGENPLSYLVQYTKAGTIVTGAYYLQGDTIQLHAQVTDARKGKLMKALDPVSGPIEDPLKPIESMQQQLMTTLSVFFEPKLKGYAGVMPPSTSYEAYRDFLKAWKLVDNREWKQAIDPCLRAIELDPEYVQAKMMAATLYMVFYEYEKADSLIRGVDERSNKLTPVDRYLLDYNKALLRGDYYGMYRAWVEIAQLAPTPNAEYNVGVFAACINRPQEAIDLITPLDPKSSGVHDYWAQLMKAHHMLGNYKKELKIARRGRRYDPDNYRLLRWEARALAALGKIKEVNRLIDEFLTLFPQRSPYFIMINTSWELRSHGYREASLQVIDRAIRWLEDRPEEEMKTRGHRFRLTNVLYTAERWEEAQVLYDGLYKEYPDDFFFLARLGAIAARRGDQDEAHRISRLLENIERPYLFGENTGYRANIAALLGEKELAIWLLQEALEQGASYQVPSTSPYDIHPNIDLEPLYDYPPFKELIKPKG